VDIQSHLSLSLNQILNSVTALDRLAIYELVDDHEVILHRLLVNLAKVGLADIDESIAKLKHKSSVGIRSTQRHLAWS